MERNYRELGRILEPVVRSGASDPVLSPVRSTAPTCPVFLLHGSTDNVIPPSETTALARWAENETKTTSLITDLVRHVDLKDDPTKDSVFAYYQLIRFWTELLRS